MTCPRPLDPMLTGFLRAERARGGEDRQALLKDILAIVLDPDVGGDQVGARLRRAVDHGRMRAAWEARRGRLPRDHGHLALMDASMSYLRSLSPTCWPPSTSPAAPGMAGCCAALRSSTGEPVLRLPVLVVIAAR